MKTRHKTRRKHSALYAYSYQVTKRTAFEEVTFFLPYWSIDVGLFGLCRCRIYPWIDWMRITWENEKKKIFYCRLNSFVNVLCSFVALCFVLFLLLPSPLSVSCAECALWQYVQSPLMLYGSSLTLVLIKLNRQKARNIFFHLAQEDVFSLAEVNSRRSNT